MNNTIDETTESRINLTSNFNLLYGKDKNKWTEPEIQVASFVENLQYNRVAMETFAK